FKVIVKDGYHSGGPGYALSNKAFIVMTTELIKDIKNCPNSGIDDSDVNACIRKYNGTMGNSRDENKRERFLPMSLMNHFMGTSLEWLNGYGEMAPKKGFECCADSLIAVHYMNSRDLVRLDLAIEAQTKNFKIYDHFFALKKPVTFKNIIKNYILLEDIENESNKYSELIKF
ncbi:Glyco -N-acetylgalactosamine 3-beta-galactosyltransferase 1, partial [Brachionus plicatilis]